VTQQTVTSTHSQPSPRVARWCQIWQILPKNTVSQKFANFFGNIFNAKRLLFFDMLIASIEEQFILD